MPISSRLLRTLALGLAVHFVGCDSAPTDTFTVTYNPAFSTATFVTEISNPYFPLVPGTTFRYTAQTAGGVEEIVVEVKHETRVVAGVTAVVVRDRVTLDGALIEDTIDWYAQDAAGNVWYLGEETAEYENGQVVSTAGSWLAGVNGAVAGVYMPAAPAVGQAYYQEFAQGEAEDRARVLRTSATAAVPAGSFSGCLETEDTTPLKREVLERKIYCAGTGNVLTVDVPTGERFELVEVTHTPAR